MAFIKYVPEVPVERQETITILPSGVLCINYKWAIATENTYYLYSLSSLK